MATTTERSTRKARLGASPRRRHAKTEAHIKTTAAREKVSRRSEMMDKTPLSRRALVPLKEAYFVGIGAIDWMLEKAIVIEKNLADRGHRRNEMLGRVASQVSTNVGEKTRSMSKRGRERMQEMGEKVGEGMHKMGVGHEVAPA